MLIAGSVIDGENFASAAATCQATTLFEIIGIPNNSIWTAFVLGSKTLIYWILGTYT